MTLISYGKRDYLFPVCINLVCNDVIFTPQPQYNNSVVKGAVNIRKQPNNKFDNDNIKIVHTMADGTVRDSIEDYEIPYNDTTAVAYNLLAKWTAEKQS